MVCMQNLVRDNGDTTFVLPHCASMTHDLPRVTALLHKHSNVYVDVSARLDRLARQPEAARAFFLANPDRILWGSDDMWPNRDAVYPMWFRFLETGDSFTGTYYGTVPDVPFQGIELPDDILRKVYGENAARLLNLESSILNSKS